MQLRGCTKTKTKTTSRTALTNEPSSLRTHQVQRHLVARVIPSSSFYYMCCSIARSLRMWSTDCELSGYENDVPILTNRTHRHSHCRERLAASKMMPQSTGIFVTIQTRTACQVSTVTQKMTLFVGGLNVFNSKLIIANVSQLASTRPIHSLPRVYLEICNHEICVPSWFSGSMHKRIRYFQRCTHHLRISLMESARSWGRYVDRFI